MTLHNKKLPQTMSAATATMLILVFVGTLAGGCNKSSSSSSDGSGTKTLSAAEVAANKQKAMDSIKNNPNIPAAQKASIIARMEGKFTPNAPPGNPPSGAPGAPK